MKKLLTILSLFMLLSLSGLAQRGSGASIKDNSTKKPKPDSTVVVSEPPATQVSSVLPNGVDTVAMFSYADFDFFLNALQGRIVGRDGTVLQLTTKEYFILVEVLNRALEPAVKKWSESQTKSKPNNK